MHRMKEPATQRVATGQVALVALEFLDRAVRAAAPPAIKAARGVLQADVIVRRLTAGAAALGEALYGLVGSITDDSLAAQGLLSAEAWARLEPHLLLVPPESARKIVIKNAAELQAWWRWWTCRATCCKPS